MCSSLRRLLSSSSSKMWMIIASFLFVCAMTTILVVRANDGWRDTSFFQGTGLNGSGVALAQQTDGKIIVWGTFTTYSGVTSSGIVRLNTNGTYDTSFVTGTGFNGAVNAVAIQSDGKILVGGAFTTYRGATANRIIRLNSDGSRDAAFTTAGGAGANNIVRHVSIDPDGKIIIGGAFTTYQGATVNKVARILTTGARDTTFAVGGALNGTIGVTTVVRQSDGKYVVGWDFTTYVAAVVNRIVRLWTTWARDTTFTSGTAFNSTVTRIIQDASGNLIVGWAFTTYQGTTVNRIVRLSAAWARDTTFFVGAFDGQVNDLIIKTDGKFFVVGAFSTFSGATVNRVMQLTSTGRLDPTFSLTGSGWGTAGVNAQALATLQQADKYIVIVGTFVSHHWVTVNRITRINGHDIYPPTTTITTGPENGSFVNTGTVAFTFTSSEPVGATFLCQLDGWSFDPCNSGTVEYVGLSNGEHLFAAYAIDAEWNIDPVGASRTFTVDTIMPTILSLTGVTQSGYISTGTIAFYFTADEPVYWGCLMDSTNFLDAIECWDPVLPTISDMYTYTGLTEGAHIFRVFGVDEASNQSATGILNFFVDLTNPTFTSASLADGALIPVGNNFPISVGYTDNFWVVPASFGSGLSLRKWNGSSYGANIAATHIKNINATTTGASLMLSGATFGRYLLESTITDVSGRTAFWDILFYVDDIGITISSPTHDLGALSSDIITFAPADLVVTVTTVGAAFGVTMNQVVPLTGIGTGVINSWDGTDGFGKRIGVTNTIEAITLNHPVGSQARSINTNGQKNTYTYPVRLGARSRADQFANDYRGEISFTLDVSYNP